MDAQEALAIARPRSLNAPSMMKLRVAVRTVTYFCSALKYSTSLQGNALGAAPSWMSSVSPSGRVEMGQACWGAAGAAPCQRLLQAFAPHGLGGVVHGVQFKRAHRMVGIGGDEHHAGGWAGPARRGPGSARPWPGMWMSSSSTSKPRPPVGPSSASASPALPASATVVRWQSVQSLSRVRKRWRASGSSSTIRMFMALSAVWKVRLCVAWSMVCGAPGGPLGLQCAAHGASTGSVMRTW